MERSLPWLMWEQKGSVSPFPALRSHALISKPCCRIFLRLFYLLPNSYICTLSLVFHLLPLCSQILLCFLHPSTQMHFFLFAFLSNSTLIFYVSSLSVNLPFSNFYLIFFSCPKLAQLSTDFSFVWCIFFPPFLRSAVCETHGIVELPRNIIQWGRVLNY